MAYGWHLEAEYESGYVHSDEHADVSPYAYFKERKASPNIFNDILEKRPNAIHGQMVRFSLVGPTERHDIDWTELPDNARPIYRRAMQRDFDPATGEGETFMTGQGFGYQYTDASGKNVKEITELSN